jgi:hypothetical protein
MSRNRIARGEKAMRVRLDFSFLSVCDVRVLEKFFNNQQRKRSFEVIKIYNHGKLDLFI